jgi:glucose-6-phosphate 1-dehydrogenase
VILDAMRGDHTLFTTAEGIERLWEVSTPLLEAPPPVRSIRPGSWGPNAIHQLVAPHAWRLPFERAWRDPNSARGSSNRWLVTCRSRLSNCLSPSKQ